MIVLMCLLFQMNHLIHATLQFDGTKYPMQDI